VLSVQNGYAFDSKAFGADGFPLIRIRDLKAGVSTETRYGAEFDPKYVVHAGDFLIGMDGEFGCYEWKGEPALLNQRVCRLQGFAQALEPRFLFYGINAHLKAIEEVTGYTTVKHLSSKQILGIEMPVPPRAEQRRIVAILDEAFEGIATAKANAEKNLQNAREFFASRMQLLFGNGGAWERVQLEVLLARGWITSHLDGNHGSDYPRKEEFVDAGVPYIAASAIKGGIVDFDEAKYLSPERAATIRKGLAKDRDVLFAHNATVGPVAILSTDEDVVILGTSLTYYRCDPQRIQPEYLAHFMISPAFTSQYAQVMKQSTRNQVPITKQREFFHVIPPIDVQRRIADELDELSMHTERLVDIERRKLIALDELKKSLLHQAFSGALNVKSTDKQLEAVA
jgi:type I restriction enzyme S subunit